MENLEKEIKFIEQQIQDITWQLRRMLVHDPNYKRVWNKRMDLRDKLLILKKQQNEQSTVTD